jgi:hypothetical protein
MAWIAKKLELSFNHTRYLVDPSLGSQVSTVPSSLDENSVYVTFNPFSPSEVLERSGA